MPVLTAWSQFRNISEDILTNFTKKVDIICKKIQKL